MRFLILSTGFSLESGEGHLLQELGEQLASEGHEVDFLVVDPTGELPRGPLPSGTPGIRAANIGRSWSFLPLRGPLKYIPANLSPWLERGWLKWLRTSYDLLLVATPGMVYSSVLAQLRRHTNVRRYALVMWDFFPIAQLEAGAVRAPGLEGLLYRAEARVVEGMDTYFVLTPKAGDFLRSYYPGATGKIEFLRPWGPDLGAESTGGRAPEVLTVVWGGNFIARRAIDDILRVAEQSKLRDLPVRFLFAGDGQTREAYEQMACDLGLTNVTFLGRLDRTEYLALLGTADVATSFLTESSSPCFPSKTVDYCQAGLPLLVTCESGNDYGSILEECGAGVSFSPGQTAEITAWLQAMTQRSGHEVLESMGRASRALFEDELDVRAAAEVVTAHAAEGRALAMDGGMAAKLR